MHAFFGLRGIKRHHDEVVKWLETRGLHMPVTMPDGKTLIVPVQASLQPITFYSYVFPEYCKDVVLTSLQFDKKVNGMASGNMLKEKVSNAKAKVFTETIRMLLGADKIPKFKKDQSLFLPKDAMENVQIIPIGVKYDIQNWKDPNGTIHEAI